LADYVIENGLLEDTEKKVIQIHEKLMKLVAID
jgi:hypothetical protein